MKKLIILFLLTIVVYFNDNTVKYFPDATDYICKGFYCQIIQKNFKRPILIPMWQIKMIQEID
jgi:hypothetical protein